MEKPPSRIDWTREAMESLYEVHEFLEETTTPQRANSVVDAIAARTEHLRRFPEMGTIERARSTRKLTFRYVVEGHYKILYTYFPDADTVEIRQVFDTRRDPGNLLKP